jgi:hypothetical protein
MTEQQDPIFNQVIDVYESLHIKRIMEFHYDWNIEVIAQFYATLFFEGGRKCEGNALDDRGRVVPYHL